ncbi:unnamed protein product [Orchesella dallaii]|uniref:Uncharacterized protein n=1 Tax=Orchesella dallaii TaxID=48710 RepID=A0ABP1RNS2_9HEXA
MSQQDNDNSSPMDESENQNTRTGTEGGMINLQPPKEGSDKPNWVKMLLEYFEYVNEETRVINEKGKSRNRIFYTLRCSLCKTNPHPKQSKKRKSDGNASSNEDVLITCSAAFAFARHLERIHPNAHNPEVYDSNRRSGYYKRKIDSEKANETILTSVIGLTGSSPATSVKKYGDDSVRQKEFRKVILDYIALDGVPLCATEREGFRILMHFVDPKLTCPSRSTIMRLLDKKSMEVL